MTGFFTELKRRNVFRVGAAYGVMGWLLIEVSSVLLPTFGAPDWVMKVFALLVILGLPVALFLAWAFELTPEGIKREQEVDRSQSITSTTGRKLDRSIIVLLVIALAYFAWDRRDMGSEQISQAKSDPTPAVQVPDVAEPSTSSIAVLPFADMSPDHDQEYFSDGMTEEILNTLVKVPNLMVAARTSSFAYKGQNKDIRVIGEELGVTHIIEGSVRKAGDDLRITAQLIRVSDGFHLWSESYNRKMDNVFAVQEEIARAVAEALQIPLGLSSAALITHRTTDMAAYEKYLRARHWIRQRDIHLADAVSALEEVVASEPDFAPAWAMLSTSRGLLPIFRKTYKGKPLTLEESGHIAEQAARRALALDDKLAEAHYAMANVLRNSAQWSAAEAEYKRAFELDSQSVDIIEDYSEFFLTVGRIKDAVNLGRKAYALSDQMPLAMVTYADTLYNARRYDEAVPLLHQIREIAPGFSWASHLLIGIAVVSGQYSTALEELHACHSCLDRGIFVHLPEVLSALSEDSVTQLSREQILESGVSETWHLAGGDNLFLEALALQAQAGNYRAFAHNAPHMDLTRTRPRYRQLVTDFGLVAYWRESGWPDYCKPLGDDDFECGAYQP